MVGFRNKVKFYVQATSTMAGMTTTYDVCIRGNGIVGSTLALLLARQRLRIALVGAPAQTFDMRAFALNVKLTRFAHRFKVLAQCRMRNPRAWHANLGRSGGQAYF
jgi:2-polyprenyl-6-methoxyphenol hydroxylase-like FAD-dependent oxidoreductase